MKKIALLLVFLSFSSIAKDGFYQRLVVKANEKDLTNPIRFNASKLTLKQMENLFKLDAKFHVINDLKGKKSIQRLRELLTLHNNRAVEVNKKNGKLINSDCYNLLNNNNVKYDKNSIVIINGMTCNTGS